ncbi:MAG TPA: YebC/PmpR family DNA-binding transcriptional regulator [Candidatus Marinimicrobia bacterium]|mgnify:FL=1|nr:YebC/PmpR family DNA-binding transcriptional regulator [Candidatus Neomarinimicrobiota bacterium]HHZ98300.1 YebC/PmpR family DNA-binding transcriptional regulator [Candidatus Neomarinimicrobiota bacterium]HIB03354.1 YebC/PmpR family DNA-binding transcriptional regulator [Candidatus Neomarinimicrobiota bacterium]HIB95688.1 YebC/PmpR family DNA-binding transcriptional regulator [Candidatus Neomarinimicrobiota bacterium]HIN62211.1 YebC/PmpR family DNA-binding transcriptional regulator [Candidat
MAGHSKWAQIKRKKAVVDAKRGQVFTKIIKEITVAARLGGGDEDANPRLRQAVLSAKAANMPADNVKRAVQKGTGELPGISYEEAIFEGYGPGGVAVMVEVTTDNRKRTVAELRHLITKHGGNLGETGCVAWMFKRKGLITIEKISVDEESLLDSILTGGGDDFSDEDDVYVVESAPDQMITVREQLEADGFSVKSSEIMQMPQSSVSVEGETAKRVIQLLEVLDDHDDVQKVSANFDVDDAEIEEVS